MKWFEIISHRTTLITSFCLILVSGEHVGGVYLWYLLLALPHGSLHVIFTLFGLGFLFYDGRNLSIPLKVLGIALLWGSLAIFFARSWEYNRATFEQVVPLITIAVFLILSIMYLYRTTRTMHPVSDAK